MSNKSINFSPPLSCSEFPCSSSEKTCLGNWQRVSIYPASLAIMNWPMFRGRSHARPFSEGGYVLEFGALETSIESFFFHPVQFPITRC